MMIPALDAVRSKRFGYIDAGSCKIAAILHDNAIENRNRGEAWQKSQPVFVWTTEETDVAHVMQNVEEYEKKDFSVDFWKEAAKIYRVVSPDYEDDGSESEVNIDNLDSEFETMFINHITHALNKEGVSHQIWDTVLEDAQWDRIEDCETGDVSLFSDSDREFTESDFTETSYIPDPEAVSEWGLYAYCSSINGRNAESLWVRLRGDNGSVREYPLVESLNGLSSIVSTNPDFGTVESNHISNEVQMALEESESLEGHPLTQVVADTELSDTTQKFIGNATQSVEITE